MNSERQFSQKSSFKLIVLFGIALVAGCAASPEDIAATYTSGDQFKGWSCEKILAEQKSVASDLAVASAKQEETRSDDIAGVILLAVPVGSMSGEDLAPKIARLKGERDALDRIAKQSNCAGAVASVDTTAGPTRHPDQPANPKNQKQSKVTSLSGSLENIPDGELSVEQIKNVLEANTFYTDTEGRFNATTLRFKATGNVSGEKIGAEGAFPEDDGKWTVGSGRQFCIRWNLWYGGRRECFRVTKRGDRLLLHDRGSRVARTYTVTNP